MRSIAPLMAVCSFALAAAPAVAANNLGCIAEGYTAADMEVVNAFLTGFNPAAPASSTPGVDDRMLDVITRRSEECAATNGWSAKAKSLAYTHRAAQMALLAYGRQRTIPTDDVIRIFTLIDGPEGAALRNQLQATVAADVDQTTPRPASDPAVLTTLLEASGVEGATQHAALLNGWLATRMLMEVTADRFAAAE